ncbi:TetR/AcrR family transcriptional regulator [Rhodohalobacter sp. SW132]|uniref:TetR/AcrR family transcriptional regulator n=1 Tax=Rhodohalobacter sp. SW132 TaxID=2293433 RepID=UPI000E251BC2|nr:TetR/AcrR family transcriptional regulator [Rhodohalobacter sp. SW132]REL24870.1 TetR/AcrR family transcriptional regulator [Rhodohalobacter sp. SW132]
MEKISRKEKERIRRRDHILDTAEVLIKEIGFDSTTMDQIAEQAEVGKGTLYLHFKSKTDIYLAICERGSRLLNEKMAAVITKDLSGLEMVRMLGTTYLEFIQENPQYFYAFSYYEGLMADETINSSDIVDMCEQNAKDGMTLIVRALQIGMQDGSIDNSYDPHQLGIMIWGASKGIINIAFLKEQGHHYKMLNEVDVSLKTMVHSFIQLIGKGISGK